MSLGTFVHGFLVKGVGDSFRSFVTQIQEINRKYAVPHVKTSPAVKFSLFMLRAYLIVLVLILFFKFYTLVR
jgi:hypothetical protein